MGIVTHDAVRQVARLARLRLEGPPLVHTAGQLDDILRYVQQLQAVPTEHVAPTSHVVPLSNVLREDVLVPSLSAEAVCALAPACRRPFVTVPKVIDA